MKGERVPCCLDDDYPFESSSAHSPTYPLELKCKCGGVAFRIHEPAFVVTVATCQNCGKAGIIHEG